MGVGGGREVQEGGDISIFIADSFVVQQKLTQTPTNSNKK